MQRSGTKTIRITGRKRNAAARCWEHATARYLIVLLLLLTACGCSSMNRYVFLPKKELTATPARDRLPFQDVWFPAGDGVQLNGWFISGKEERPLILFFHGNSGNLSDNLEYLNLLHSQGFPIFIFDYRGYGKSQGEPRRENDLYQDARGAVTYLAGQGWQHEKTIFFGQSLGAAVALQMALESPPAGLVMESSFTSMNEIMQYVSAVAYYTVGWWGIDLSFDNLAKIRRVKIPLLLIHGNKDTVVPVEMARRLFAEGGGTKMLHIVSEGGHCNAFEQGSAAYLAAWNNYLAFVAGRKALM